MGCHDREFARSLAERQTICRRFLIFPRNQPALNTIGVIYQDALHTPKSCAKLGAARIGLDH